MNLKQKVENMKIKVLMQKKRLNQALEQNKFLEKNLETLEGGT